MPPPAPRRLALGRTAAVGGISMAALMILCWIGTFIPFARPTHAFIGLFSRAATQSVQALLEGTLWAFLFGLLAGAIVAIAYNAMAMLER